MSAGEAPDDLKKLLVSRGYLTSPVGRIFVRRLQDYLKSGRGLVRLQILAALFTGALLSILLGAAILIQDPRPETFLLSIYYFPVLSLFLFFLYLSLSGILWAAFRVQPLTHPIRLSRLLGLAVSLISAFMLWKPIFMPSGLLSIPTIALLFFTLAVYAILTPALMTLTLTRYHLPIENLTRARPWMIGALLTFVIVAVIAGNTYLSPSLPGFKEGVPPTLSSMPPRTMVVILDGVSIRGAKFSSELETILSRSTIVPYTDDYRSIPAVNWTEVTTGFPAAVNGVQTLDAIQVLGIERPFTRLPLSSILRTLRIARRSISTHTARLCPTLWEWSASAGIPSNVVNTWSSWPPWNQSPRIVSNLELLHRLSGEKSKAFQPGNIEENIPDTIPAGAPGFALDKIALETLRAMRENHPPILEVLYLPGCDIAFHAAVRNDLSDLLETENLLTDQIRYLGVALADLASETTRVILILHPGRTSSAPSYLCLYPSESPGIMNETVTSMEITPAILEWLHLPVHVSMVRPTFADPWNGSEIRTVSTFPPRDNSLSSGVRPPLEELRSLGYLQ